MDDRTKQTLESVIESDADEVLMVAVDKGGASERDQSQLVADLPPSELTKLLGLLLVGAEEALEVPAPLVAYEASKLSEQLEEASDAIIYQELTGDGE